VDNLGEKKRSTHCYWIGHPPFTCESATSTGVDNIELDLGLIMRDSRATSAPSDSVPLSNPVLT